MGSLPGVSALPPAWLLNHDRIYNNNKAPETGEWVCGVGVGVRRGLRGASVKKGG